MPDSVSDAVPDPRPDATPEVPYGSIAPVRRITTRNLQARKDRGERFTMLTSYDCLTAAVFDEAGVPVLLVGDSAGNNVLGYADTVPVTVDELLPLVRGVVAGSARALVVADLPFGSYQAGPEQALASAVRMVKEGGAQAVKLEGGARVAAQVAAIVGAGIPVMAHVGFTPQSVNALGYRVQGRGGEAEQVLADAEAVAAAGAFAVVLEMVAADVAERVTKTLTVPTIGIGAGPSCDAQVLVWTDMAGLTPPPVPRLAKAYADLRGQLLSATRAFADEVASGAFPGPEQTYT